jgi:hypothetical protein
VDTSVLAVELERRKEQPFGLVSQVAGTPEDTDA